MPFFLWFGVQMCYNHRTIKRRKIDESDTIPFSTQRCHYRVAVPVRGFRGTGAGTDPDRSGPQRSTLHRGDGDPDLSGDDPAERSAYFSGLILRLYRAHHLRCGQMGDRRNDERAGGRGALLCGPEPVDPPQGERLYPPPAAPHRHRTGHHDHRADPRAGSGPDGHRTHR